jgi:ubiquinone/menaquinone biosynthesis C-methylase UbiE
MSDAAQKQPDEFRARVQREWDDPETVSAWRKWSRRSSQTFAGVTRALVEASGARAGHTVLDVASGAGVPALALAAAVAPTGHVVATDQSPEMLRILADNAHLAGHRNVRCEQTAAESLPFSDASFDAVTCRFGVMFFPEPLQALRQAWRVLRPGGRAIFVAWGPAAQPFFEVTAGVLRNHVDMPAPPPGAPHVFRFSEPGSLAQVFRDAGFSAVGEKALRIPCERPGSPEDFWEEFREVAAPFRPLIAALPPDRRAALDRDVLAAIRQHHDGQAFHFHAEVNLAVGTRP